jgi:uroporphyrinogen decarboxylase
MRAASDTPDEPRRMTSRERVRLALRRQRPDRVPTTLYEEVIGYVPGMARALAENGAGDSPGEFFGCDVRSVSIGVTRLSRTAGMGGFCQPGVRVDEWGVGWESGGYLHYEKILSPLQLLTPSEVRDYVWPDLEAEYRYVNVKAEVELVHKRGLAVTAYPGSIFECAWQLRGMGELFDDICHDPATAGFLLDGITQRVQLAAERLAEAGIDILILGDDIATQRGLLMSLHMWNAVFKPRLQRVIRAAKAVNPELIVFYHSDGNVWDAIPDLIDAGVEVLNPVQPECMDPAAVKKAFGDRLAFFGTVSIQRTMPFGSPADVEAEVRERIRTVGAGGGLLIAPSHVLQPDTPWVNIEAFFSAVDKYGWYDSGPR